MKLFVDGLYIIEEIIKQKGILHKINESSVNTMRVNTLLDHGKVEVLCAFLRTGREGSVTDNLHAGGILWQINISNGEILFGVQADGKIIDTHPDSNIRLAGEKIAGFQQALQVCIEAQKRVPEVPQVGWDVVISDADIYLIEGNSGAGFWNCEKSNNCWKRMKKYLIGNYIPIVSSLSE